MLFKVMLFSLLLYLPLILGRKRTTFAKKRASRVSSAKLANIDYLQYGYDILKVIPMLQKEQILVSKSQIYFNSVMGRLIYQQMAVMRFPTMSILFPKSFVTWILRRIQSQEKKVTRLC